MRFVKFIFLFTCLAHSAAHAQEGAHAQEHPSAPEAQGQGQAESKGTARALEWSDADCEPGDRVAPHNGESDERKLERWFCRPRSPLRVVVGVSVRGVRSEGGSFSDTIGFEAAGRFLSRFDLGVGVGRVFRERARASVDVHSRLFLFDLPTTGGPYLGGGVVVTKEQRGFVTLGFFGGSGFFFELQFRGSDKQPIALIPAFGLRAAFL